MRTYIDATLRSLPCESVDFLMMARCPRQLKLELSNFEGCFLITKMSNGKKIVGSGFKDYSRSY